MRWIVDSIEEDVAAIEAEGGRTLRVPLSLLPEGVREGDVLSVERTETRAGRVTLCIDVDPRATDDAYRKSERQVRRKPGKRAARDPGGDIEL
jgi:hypothetical protein